MSHFAIAVDLDLCTGCRSCEVACKQENGVALGEYWNKVVEITQGTFPDLKKYWMPTMCQQCADAPCVHVCPTGASYRDPDTNVVLINKEVCIGCKYCMMACPYGVRSWNAEERCVEKCTLCQHLTSVGERPACVKNCTCHCRHYGDLDDPNSEISQFLKSKPEGKVRILKNTGNNPQARYVLSDSTAQWKEEGR